MNLGQIMAQVAWSSNHEQLARAYCDYGLMDEDPDLFEMVYYVAMAGKKSGPAFEDLDLTKKVIIRLLRDEMNHTRNQRNRYL